MVLAMPADGDDQDKNCLFVMVGWVMGFVCFSCVFYIISSFISMETMMTSYQMTHVISEILIKHAQQLGEATGRVGTRVLVLQNELEYTNQAVLRKTLW